MHQESERTADLGKVEAVIPASAFALPNLLTWKIDHWSFDPSRGAAMAPTVADVGAVSQAPRVMVWEAVS
jgi:hypothetical protein